MLQYDYSQKKDDSSIEQIKFVQTAAKPIREYIKTVRTSNGISFVVMIRNPKKGFNAVLT